MSIPLSYQPTAVVPDKKGQIYVRIPDATEVELRKLILSGCVLTHPAENALPFFIESISDTPFYVKVDLDGLVSILSIFKDRSVSIFNNGKEKELVPQELTRFIFS